MAKSLFKFIQLRNVPRPRIRKTPDIEEHRPGNGDTHLPDIKNPDRVPHDLDIETPELKFLIEKFKKGHDDAPGLAMEHIQRLKNRSGLYFSLTKIGRLAGKHGVKSLDVLMPKYRKFMQAFQLDAEGLTEIKNHAANAYGAMLLLDSQKEDILVAGEQSIRAIQIVIELSRKAPDLELMNKLANAQVRVNGLTRRNVEQEAKVNTKLVTARADIARKVSVPMVSEAARRERIVPYNGSMIRVPASSQISSFSAGAPGVPHGVGTPRKVSVGELHLIEEVSYTYDMADIAYVENVMQSEHRSRLHEIRTKEETEDYSETETSETSVNELKTTEQFEIEEAMNKASSSAQSASVGTQFTASYGPVSASGQASASASASQSEAQSRASNYAKEIIERTVNEVSKNVKSSRRFTSNITVIERNRHGFDNRLGTGHVVGVYRYLNRKAELNTVNYGRRLMLEFIVPEPATSMIHTLADTTPPGVALDPPKPFEFSEGIALRPDHIMPDNYEQFMDMYEVRDLPPPPAAYMKIPSSFTVQAVDKTEYNADDFANKENNPDHEEAKIGRDAGKVSINIPDGYHLTKLQMSVAFSARQDGSPPTLSREWVRVACDRSVKTIRNYPGTGDREEIAELSPTKHEGSIDVAWAATVRYGIAVSLSAECALTDSGLKAWQIAIWQELHTAYLAEKRAFDSQLAYVQSTQSKFEDSPLMNRLTEARELKRSVVSMLTEQDFGMFGSIDPQSPHTINHDEAFIEGEYIRFFEDCFEWDNLVYEFYDYTWAGNGRWSELLGRTSNDVLHEKFLQSGAARVIVPAKPGYEIALLNFLENGTIWTGEHEPNLDSNHTLYKEVLDMIAEPRDLDTTVIGTEFVTLPTNLVILQGNESLNDPQPPGPIETPPPYPDGSEDTEEAETDSEDLNPIA